MRMVCQIVFLVLLSASTVSATVRTAADYFSLGTKLYNAKDYEGAHYAFEAGLVLDPQSAEGYQGLGDSLYFSGHQYDALQAYQKSLALNPNNPKLEAFVKSFKPNDVPTATVTGTQEVNGEERVVVTGQDLGATGDKSGSQEGTQAPKPDLRLALDKSTWVRGYLGYDFALLGDLIGGISALSSENANTVNNVVTDTGSNGLLAGVEFGIAIDSGNAFSISVENVWTQSQTFSNGVSDISDPTALFEPSFQPDLMSVSLNYYAFIPGEKGSRSYIQLGAGVYQTVVGFTGWDPSTVLSGEGLDPNETGTFTATSFGGTFGFGETFAIGKDFGFDISGRGRIVTFSQATAAQITNGGAISTNGPYAIMINTANSAIAVEPVNPNIGNGYRYAVIDYSGFDISSSFNFYF